MQLNCIKNGCLILLNFMKSNKKIITLIDLKGEKNPHNAQIQGNTMLDRKTSYFIRYNLVVANKNGTCPVKS